jgi:hypothetical protein
MKKKEHHKVVSIRYDCVTKWEKNTMKLPEISQGGLDYVK